MSVSQYNLKEVERKAIIEALIYMRGHRGNTASILGISVRCLRNKLTLYGLKDYLK